MLKRRPKSPPSSSEQALDQLVKGCQLAIHSATILAKETDNYMLQMKSRSKSACIEQGSLSVEEAHTIISEPIEAQIARMTVLMNALCQFCSHVKTSTANAW